MNRDRRLLIKHRREYAGHDPIKRIGDWHSTIFTLQKRSKALSENIHTFHAVIIAQYECLHSLSVKKNDRYNLHSVARADLLRSVRNHREPNTQCRLYWTVLFLPTLSMHCTFSRQMLKWTMNMERETVITWTCICVLQNNSWNVAFKKRKYYLCFTGGCMGLSVH